MKTLDWRVLAGDGYLQEVNRLFFHPLGLALAVTVADDRQTGTLSVLDARDDPEGFAFVPGTDLREKAASVARITDARRETRTKALGYWQQPVSDVAAESRDHPDLFQSSGAE